MKSALSLIGTPEVSAETDGGIAGQANGVATVTGVGTWSGGSSGVGIAQSHGTAFCVGVSERLRFHTDRMYMVPATQRLIY